MSNSRNSPRSSHGSGPRRLPAEVYRRRRLALLGMTVVVLALFVTGIVLLVQAVRGSDSQTQTASPETTDEAVAPGPEGDEAQTGCPSESVAVSAKTDKESYKPGSTIKLELGVKNTSDSACEIAVGSDVQTFTVQKDGTTVWSSDYCLAGDQEESVQVFAAGASKRSVLGWEMVPTDRNCNRTADALEAGQYQFIATLGDVESEPATFAVEGASDSSTQSPGEPGDAQTTAASQQG